MWMGPRSLIQNLPQVVAHFCHIIDDIDNKTLYLKWKLRIPTNQYIFEMKLLSVPRFVNHRRTIKVRNEKTYWYVESWKNTFVWSFRENKITNDLRVMLFRGQYRRLISFFWLKPYMFKLSTFYTIPFTLTCTINIPKKWHYNVLSSVSAMNL